MCTVTFLPKAKGNFILTSNRDEDPQRASFELSRQTIGGRPVHFPKDPKAGGTWLATDKSDLPYACSTEASKNTTTSPHTV